MSVTTIQIDPDVRNGVHFLSAGKVKRFVGLLRERFQKAAIFDATENKSGCQVQIKTQNDKPLYESIYPLKRLLGKAGWPNVTCLWAKNKSEETDVEITPANKYNKHEILVTVRAPG